MSVISKKICLLGDFSVGKTSLIGRFVEGKFNDNYLSTVGVKISRKSLKIKTLNELKQTELLIWDLEGHTKFKSITPSYLKGASGAIVVADLTRVNTLETIHKHLDLFFKINPDGWATISLNKLDLVKDEKLEKLVEKYGKIDRKQVNKIYFTSAKTGNNVNDIFQNLAENIVN